MYFSTPTKNFSLYTTGSTYGRWQGPEDWPRPLNRKTFLWLTLDGVDLPDAWQAVQAAGWTKPLNSFRVYKSTGRTYNGEVIYRFTNDALIVSFGVQSKKIRFRHSGAMAMADESSGFADSMEDGESGESEVASS